MSDKDKDFNGPYLYQWRTGGSLMNVIGKPDIGKSSVITREEIQQKMVVNGDFPKVGDILIFKGVPEIYYPHYACMGNLAKENLIVGQKYQVRNVEIYSSWCAVWLDGFPDDESYNLSFFEGYPKTKKLFKS